MKSTQSLIVISLLLVPFATVHGENWPRFLGPNGRATSILSKIPVEWNDSTNLKWKAPIGPGSSSPIVWEDRVFVTSYAGEAGNVQRSLHCIDRKTGDERWAFKVKNEGREDAYQGYITEHGYASSTPVTDGELVYAFFLAP